MTGLLVFAPDGADLHYIRQGVEQGRLPHLARLMAKGVWGPLRSTMPPVSCPAWPSLYTGKNPGRLGLYQFQHLKSGTYRTTLSDTRVPDARLWEILSDSAYTVGVVCMPLTWPPDPINGTMVSPLHARSDEFYYPPEARLEIESRIGRLEYLLSQEPRDQLNVETVLASHVTLERNRLTLARAVLERGACDFFMCGFNVDRVHHYVAETDHILKFYAHLDALLGEVLEMTQPDNVMVVSDHGGGPFKGRFRVNRWLIDQGYLRSDSGAGLPLHIRLARHLPMERIRLALNMLGLRRLSHRLVRDRRVRAQLRHAVAPLYHDAVSNIDWARTLAFSPVNNTIFINLKGRQPRGSVLPRDYDAVRQEITARLRSARHPETGEPVPFVVRLREEVYNGPHLHEMPDVVFFSPDYESSTTFGPHPFTGLEASGPRRGQHRLDGIFIARGQDISHQANMPDLSVLDITPTALHLMGAPIPDDVDGHVLDIYRPNSSPAHRPPDLRPAAAFLRQRRPADEDDAAVIERLRALGYLD